MKDLWYKRAIIDCLDVGTCMDTNGDGVGDCAGVTKRLDDLAGLGVTCLGLLPCYPSPHDDNGYDVTDYYGIDPRHGTLGDFVECMHQARERGMRVILDLVVNHTSVKHPWFQSARRDEKSPYRDFYVWSKQKPEVNLPVLLPGEQKSVWTYDRKAKAYYLHRFYKQQPDLNISNPAVRDEICKVMGFWLELGIFGFRVDAAPYLIEQTGADAPGTIDPYGYLKEFRDLLTWRCGDAILLAEADVELAALPGYFGAGDRLQMLFNFVLNQHLFLALARQEAAPLIVGLLQPPNIPETAQWANFLRHHDELTLDRLSPPQREPIFQAFAPEARMQIYGRGVRRRLAPMLNGDPHRLRLAYSLLLTLPGTPVVYYGDEIGMGDDLTLEGRTSVRTAMQWSDEPNGGFSTAPKNRLGRINVASQQRDPESLLNWLEKAIGIRKDCPAFGSGQLSIVETGDAAVFAHCSAWQGKVVAAVHNLSDTPREVSLDLSSVGKSHVVDLLGDRESKPLDGGRTWVKLEGYGYRWFRVGSA